MGVVVLRLLTLSLFLAAASVGHAQQTQQFDSGTPPKKGPTLSDVWGSPKMPAEPKDFGPHFDFPAGGSETLLICINRPNKRLPLLNTQLKTSARPADRILSSGFIFQHFPPLAWHLCFLCFDGLSLCCVVRDKLRGLASPGSGANGKHKMVLVVLRD